MTIQLFCLGDLLASFFLSEAAEVLTPSLYKKYHSNTLAIKYFCLSLQSLKFQGKK